MKKIGFADYYLNNWHCDNYPEFLRKAIATYGYDFSVSYAYGMLETPPNGGVSSKEWTRERNISLCSSMEELVDKSDAIMVIAADDSTVHEKVSQLALMSGKPVFVDKTFASDLPMAKRMFKTAKEHSTPVFSSSAQRYCQDLIDYKRENPGLPTFVSTVGPHSIDMYAVHQLEVIVALMGTGVKRIKGFAVGDMVTNLVLDYGNNRMASFVQTPQPWAEFNFMVSKDGNTGVRLKSDDSNFYDNLAKAILDFFTFREPPVSEEETLEVIALIDAAREARNRFDEWIEVKI